MEGTVIAGSGLLWLEVAGSGWKVLEIAGMADVPGYVWKWLEITEN